MARKAQMASPQQLDLDRARALVGMIQSALWAERCRCNPDKEWTADTLNEIAEAMAVFGMAPK